MITFDYRGFGKSAGEPSEEGLIEDGVAVSSPYAIRLSNCGYREVRAVN